MSIPQQSSQSCTADGLLEALALLNEGNTTADELERKLDAIEDTMNRLLEETEDLTKEDDDETELKGNTS